MLFRHFIYILPNKVLLCLFRISTLCWFLVINFIILQPKTLFEQKLVALLSDVVSSVLLAQKFLVKQNQNYFLLRFK